MRIHCIDASSFATDSRVLIPSSGVEFLYLWLRRPAFLWNYINISVNNNNDNNSNNNTNNLNNKLILIIITVVIIIMNDFRTFGVYGASEPFTVLGPSVRKDVVEDCI